MGWGILGLHYCGFKGNYYLFDQKCSVVICFYFSKNDANLL